jgi:transitional endoplasmic reticulum ATPase
LEEKTPLEINVLVTDIIDTNLEDFFYIGIDNHFNRSFRPFDTVCITGDSKLAHIGVLQLKHLRSKGGLEISRALADYLKIKEGDTICIEKIYNVPNVNMLEIMCLDSQKEDKTLEKQVQQLKKILYYCYVSDSFTFTYKNRKYIVKIRQSNKTHCQITPSTKIIFKSSTEAIAKKYHILGLEKAYDAIKQIIEWPLYYPDEFNKLNIEMPKGILLYGPPGCGKTHLVRQISRSTNWAFYHIRGPEILNKYLGGSEKHIRQVFENAKKNQPSIIFFDEIDSIGSKRGSSNEAESRVVSQLLTCLDGLENRGMVLVIAATNSPNLLDPALRRPGRFDKEIQIKAPVKHIRYSLLKYFLESSEAYVDQDVDLNELARKTNGFVNADLKFLVNEAKLNVLRRLEKKDSKARLKVSKEDFDVVLKSMKPSMLREFNLLKDDTKLQNIIGYDQVKKRIFDQVYYPIKYPHLFNNLNLKKLKGIILEGPPGTGKTSLAKALASELDYNFMVVKGPEIVRKYVGETETNIRNIFEKARATAPCIVFFDQIDSLFTTSSEVLTQSHDISKTGQLLSELDGLVSENEEIIIVGTTNKAHLLDKALLRAGRFELVLTMDYPNKKELIDLYKFYFKSICDQNVKYDSVASYSLNYNLTGADICAIKRRVVVNYISKTGSNVLKSMEESAQKDVLNLKLTEADIFEGIKQFLKTKKETSIKSHGDY